MLTKRSVVSMFLAAMVVLFTGVAPGQNYPNKPIRIFTSGAGSGSDAATRMIAQGISGPLGQPVIAENRGSALVAAPIVVQSPPDGYSLLFAGDVIWLGPLLRGQPDALLKDLSPISLLASAPSILVVHPSLPVKSVKELIALAKARPGELNYGVSAVGGIDHIAGELLKSMAGVNIVGINYKGGSESVIGLVAGEVQIKISNVALLAAHIKSGRLRALAATSLQPSALFPDLPTMAASGLPGYEIIGVDALYAPAKTPAAIIDQLNREIVRFLRSSEGKEKYLSLGAEVVASSPEELSAKTKSRIATISKVVRDAGIKLE